MAETMKAAVFEGEGRLAIKDMPVPRIQRDDEVLLEVEGCGICGTDVHILDVPPGHPATPGVILGHEYVGRVQEVGPAVVNLIPGDRVVIAPNLACGLCTYCRLGRPNQCENFTTLGIYLNGGFARYNVAPERACFKIAPDLPVEEAVFTELLSCVVGGTERVRLQPGESAIVLGAGPVGLMFILAFKAAGAGQIIASDLAPFRLEYARKVGAGRVVNPKEEDVIAVVKEATGLGADVVVDSVGSLFDQAVNAACKGGKVVLFGMNQQARPAVSQYDITRNELTIYGTFIGINTFPIAIKMLESGVLKPSVLLSRSVSLAEMPKAIEQLRAGQAIKIMATPR